MLHVPAHLGYPVLFALIFGESAGVPLPGETALLTAGVLAGGEQRGLTREGDARGLAEDQREQDRIAQVGGDVEHRDRSCRGSIGPS